MKTVNFLKLSAAALFLVATAASAGTIATSAHDFSGNGWAGGEICVPCHAPHDNSDMIANGLLWNHEVTTSTFTLYDGLDMQGTVRQPDGSSKLCLSCHDGTVAIDSFGGGTGSTNIGSGALVGTDLHDDHPISMDYNTLDLELNATTSAVVWANLALAAGTIADLLEGGSDVQCSSCHDVHNTKSSDTAGKLLVIDNDGSGLCLTCHAK